MAWVAYIDESMRAPRDGAEGLYVLAAAVLDEADIEASREEVRALSPRGGLKFHWREELEPRRAKAIGVVAQLPALHLVVVGVSLNPGKQERGRRLCMARMFNELESADVEQVWMESRRPRDNRRDLQVVNAFRTQRIVTDAIRVDHAHPAGPTSEPLLWVPDIVAGVITGGADQHRAPLEPVLVEHRTWLD